jgi:hypothetical protein
MSENDKEKDAAQTQRKPHKTLRAMLPSTLQNLYDINGSSALIIFAGGFIAACIFALGLFYSGKIPLSLIPDEYKQGSQSVNSKDSQLSELRGKPSGLEVHTVESLPDWVTPIKAWLQGEASSWKKENLISGFMTEMVETQELSATNEFKWILKVSSSDYKIVGWGFRVTGQDPSKFLIALERKKITADRDSIVFTVPKCEKGDKLIAIIRVSWEKNATPVDFLSTFRSMIE